MFAARLREPRRASATTRLYRSYLRTLVATARGSGPPEPRPTIPTLLMIGARDRAVTPRLATGLDRGGDDMRTEVVPGAGHFICDTHPQSWPPAMRSLPLNERLQRFTASADPRSSLHATSSPRGGRVALLACRRRACSERWGDRPRPDRRRGLRRTAPGLVASRFTVTPRTLSPGAAASFRYRIDGAQRSVRVRIELLPAGARRPAARIRMGWKRTGRTLKPHAGRRPRAC